MTRVAITGASGFVGRRLLDRFAASCWEPLPLVKRPSALPKEVPIGPLEEAKDIAIPEVSAFVHLASRAHVVRETAGDAMEAYRRTNVAGTRSAIELAHAAGAEHFLYVSSVKAMGEETEIGSPLTEATPAHPEDAYGKTKLEAENLVRQRCTEFGMAWTILRPPLVYGPGVKANFRKLARLVRGRLPLPFASVHNRRSLVYVDNLCDFIAWCLSHPQSRDEIYLVADPRPYSLGGIVTALAHARGEKPRMFPMPVALMRRLCKIIGRGQIGQSLFGNLEIDTTKLGSTGWREPYSPQEGFARTIAAMSPR